MLRFKMYFSRILGLFLCLAITFLAIISNNGFDDQTPESQGSISEIPELFTPVPSLPEAEQEDYYDPVSEIIKVEGEGVAASPYKHEYWAEMGNQAMLETLIAQGYTLTAESFDISNTKLGVLGTSGKIENVYSQKSEKIQVPESSVNDKGGITTKYKEVEADTPLLRPYYGYLIYTKGKQTQLLDKNCKLLLDITGYKPAYLTDIAGNPLFEKEGKYYFYYDGKNKNGVFYHDITNDDLAKLPASAPTAYNYFTFDRVCLQNFFATNKAENASMWGVTYTTEQKAGMVEYKHDPALINDLKLSSYSYGAVNHGLYPFPSFEYEVEIINQSQREEAAKKGEEIPKAIYNITIFRIFWGYMDEKGNTVIEPQFNKAYNFSKDGYAVVEDRHGHICTIDKKGSIVYNPYDDKNLLYFPDMGNQKIRDGYYAPDTYGKESTGMLYYDNGYCLMRRILLDTENGNKVLRESLEVVDIHGNRVVYPSDYKLVSYGEGLLLLTKNGRYGFMNTKGEWVVEPNLTYASNFSEGLCVVGYSDGKLGVIDSKGNVILPFIYKHIEDCSGGLITAYAPEGGWSVYQKLTTVKSEKKAENPLITLKFRAIAQARADFYKVEE